MYISVAAVQNERSLFLFNLKGGCMKIIQLCCMETVEAVDKKPSYQKNARELPREPAKSDYAHCRFSLIKYQNIS